MRAVLALKTDQDAFLQGGKASPSGSISPSGKNSPLENKPQFMLLQQMKEEKNPVYKSRMSMNISSGAKVVV